MQSGGTASSCSQTLPAGELLRRCFSPTQPSLLQQSGSFNFPSVLQITVTMCSPRYHSCWNPHEASCNYNTSVGNVVCVLWVDRQMEGFLRKSIMPKVQDDRTVGVKLIFGKWYWRKISSFLATTLREGTARRTQLQDSNSSHCKDIHFMILSFLVYPVRQ